ncbi:sugar ABC transporter substrate-binding protein [Anaerocolumna jejuensis]|uniref:sugar ABC transporter substrate-binding protein n=1 Tax=Anaerocolumna jejuensis TaxID=259063 RepID=UPI003F7CD0E0
MKAKNVLAVILAGIMAVSLAACGKNSSADKQVNTDDAKTGVTGEAAQDYTYGADVTFHSDEPVTYSMMYSDHENYPYNKDWLLWSAIQEKTNVTFDLNVIARTDYEDKKSVLINSGDAPYIIPKTYDEGKYVAGGQVVAISDWVQYMPNYQKCVKDWNMEPDLKAKLQADGKYYVLPGMWEKAGGGYAYIIRKDIFDAAGVDVTKLEKKWTYEDFYEACKKVKEYTGSDYVISDASKGDCLLNISAVPYGVKGGWGIGNGLNFDQEKKGFYFADTTDNAKAWLTYLSKMVKDGILDPESFSQEDDAAKAKFFTGESYVISGNYQNLNDFSTQMQQDGSKLYMALVPGGAAGLPQMENSRLENGIMISQKALDELGKDKFIKMLRFVDWLWYSEEGHVLSQWGVEGKTYTKDTDGNIVLNSDISYNGLNPEAAKKLNVDYGFGGGVFAYGGPLWLKNSKMATAGEKDYDKRIQDNREVRPLDPPFMANEEETEELSLIQTPLIDSTKVWIQKFITGQADISTQWDSYVSELKGLGMDTFVTRVNEIFQKNKSKLGY